MNMKKFLLMPAAALLSLSGFADTITPATSAQWNVWTAPSGIRASGFWDGPSSDGTACNIGYWFTSPTNLPCANSGGGFAGGQPGAIPFLSVAGSPTSPVRFSVTPSGTQRAITLKLKVTSYAGNEFGYYLLSSPGTLNPLFSSNHSVGQTANMIVTGPFGFYLKNGANPSQTFKSQIDHNFALFSKTPAAPASVSANLSEYFVAVEDQPVPAGPYSSGFVGNIDADYNDVVAHMLIQSSDPAGRGCVLTQGGYKNRYQYLVIQSAGVGMGIGNPTYTPSQINAILRTPVAGNGLISLAHQLITAKLNVYFNASAPQNVLDAIAAADVLIGSRLVPPVGSGYLTPAETSVLAAILDNYNNGKFGTPHCG